MWICQCFAIVAFVTYHMISLRSDVLTVVLLKFQASWNVVLHLGLCCSSHFRGSWYLLILGQGVQEDYLDTLTFEMSGTTCPMAHHYTSEVLNLKYGIVIRGVNFYTGSLFRCFHYLYVTFSRAPLYSKVCALVQIFFFMILNLFLQSMCVLDGSEW